MKSTLSRQRPPHVALLIETSMAYGRGILEGVTRYVRGERAVDGLPGAGASPWATRLRGG